MESSFYSSHSVYLGDLHNHCGISYGHGLLESALENATLQLDFVAVTGHAAWPDIDDHRIPAEVVAYHQRGFEQLRRSWKHYTEVVEAANTPGEFVTFHSYEIHSFRFGDRTVVRLEPVDEIDTPESPEELKDYLESVDSERDKVLLIPHHIGYKRGYRGVNWDSMKESASPVVEIVSMHGIADEQSGFPYLHTMGPLDGENQFVRGFAKGLHFGVIGSTDHHSAHPGSFGYGKVAVWAEALTRESLWKALLERRTYALTGNRIRLEFSVNGNPMGSRIVSAAIRRIEVRAEAWGEIDRVEVYKNGCLVHRHTPTLSNNDAERGLNPSVRFTHGDETDDLIDGYLYLEVGWGEKRVEADWDVHVRFQSSSIRAVEPRFRGKDVVDPLDTADGVLRFSSWKQSSKTDLSFKTKTFGNATSTSCQTQGIAFRVSGGQDATVVCHTMGQDYCVRLRDLESGAKTFYTNGFVSPAIKFHKFVSLSAARAETVFDESSDASLSAHQGSEDWYYTKVVLSNGHLAISTPIWVSSA